MKFKNLFLILVLSILFTSCNVTQTPANTQVSVNWDYSYYDYDQIHYLYTNYPSYFWNYQYMNPYGVRTYYYNHPYFIQYRRDCAQRNVRYTPYRRYINTPTVTHNRPVYQNRGRSNQQYRQPQRTHTTSSVTRSRPTYRSTPQRSTYRSSTPQRSSSIQRSSSTQRTRSVSPSRSRNKQ